MALKEDYKDAVFAGLRKYKMLDNGDGTVSPVDMTEYEAAGDKFGAKDVNAITKTVNATGEIIADDNDEFKPNQKYMIGRIVIYDNKTWRFKVDHEPGEWDESQVERTNILGEIAEAKKQCNELNEKMAVEFGSFNPSNTSIIIIQGSPIIIKYGKICYVHMILSIKQYLNTGDIIGDISFKPNSDITNIPIYTEGTNQQSGIHAFSLYSTGQIKAFSSMPEGGYIFDIMYEVA